VKEVIDLFMSLILIEMVSCAQEGSSYVKFIDALFILVQLAKGPELSRQLAYRGSPDLSRVDGLLEAMRNEESDIGDELVDYEDSFIDEFGWRVTATLGPYELESGATPHARARNLRRRCGLELLAGLSAAATEEPAAAPLSADEAQALLDCSSLVIVLYFAEMAPAQGYGMYNVSIGNKYKDVLFNGNEEVDYSYYFLSSLVIEGSTYQASRLGREVFLAVQEIVLDPLTRLVSFLAEATLQYMAEQQFAGLLKIVADQNEVSDIRHIAVWPSEAGYFFPFWLLPYQGGILADKFVVTVIASLRNLSWEQGGCGDNKVLAIGSANGGVRYGLSAEPTLDSTAREIAESFGSEALVGRRASPQRILGRLGMHQFVHISAHGYQDLSAPMFHCVLLNSVNGDDGRLFAHDVVKKDLRFVRLVSLNACEGGLMRFDENEEVVGLPAAFLRAGAGAVVGALWKVQPEVGATFYKYLYTCLRAGAGTIRAFRFAQEKVRLAFPEYRDWGAFCFVGYGGLEGTIEERRSTGG